MEPSEYAPSPLYALIAVIIEIIGRHRGAELTPQQVEAELKRHVAEGRADIAEAIATIEKPAVTVTTPPVVD